jgi:hypothetical protein
MGAAKDLMMQQEDVEVLAGEVAHDAGVLHACEFHSVLWRDSAVHEAALQGAYKLANYRITNGQLELPRGFSRRDMTDAIKSVVEEAPTECYLCAHIFGKDD